MFISLRRTCLFQYSLIIRHLIKLVVAQGVWGEGDMFDDNNDDDDDDDALDLVHGGDVAGLDVVLQVLNLLLELVNRHLEIFYCAHYGQLVDAVAHGDELGCNAGVKVNDAYIVCSLYTHSILD